MPDRVGERLIMLCTHPMDTTVLLLRWLLRTPGDRKRNRVPGRAGRSGLAAREDGHTGVAVLNGRN